MFYQNSANFVNDQLGLFLMNHGYQNHLKLLGTFGHKLVLHQKNEFYHIF